MNSLVIIAVLLGLTGEPAQEAMPVAQMSDFETAVAVEQVVYEDTEQVVGDFVIVEETETKSASENQQNEKPQIAQEEAVLVNSTNVIIEETAETQNTNPVVTIEMESGEKIVIELYPEYAPNTVANFVYLTQRGFYDGLGFHRIVPEFIIQGGDPEGNGTGTPGYTIDGEYKGNGFAQNTLSHERGVISMARAMDPNSAGSQFFICVEDSAFLDGNYAAFGKVIEGMNVVDKIVAGEAVNEMAVNPRIVKSITVDTKGQEWPLPLVYMEKEAA